MCWKERIPRLTMWLILAIVLLTTIATLSPQQIPVVIYKLCLVSLGGVLGYWLDRALFPYARPHTQLVCRGGSLLQVPQMATPPALLMLRRAVVVLACIIGMTLGL